MGGLQEEPYGGRGNVIGKVCDYEVGLSGSQHGRVLTEDVALNDGQIGGVRELPAEVLDHGRVDLHGDDVTRSLEESISKEASDRSDFDNSLGAGNLGGVNNRVEDTFADEEVLAQPLAERGEWSRGGARHVRRNEIES